MKLSSENKASLDLLIPTSLASYVAIQQYKMNPKDYRTLGITSLIVFVMGYIITSQITKSIVNNTADSTSASDKTDIMTRYGLTSSDFTRIESIASDVHSAFHSSSWSEDETRAIEAIKKCGTVEQVKAVCEVYSRNYGKSLKSDFVSYVHITDGYYSIPSFIRENWF